MMIPYKEIVKKWRLRSMKNVLHIGAHEGQEHNDYFDNGVDSVIWIEANPTLADNLRNRVDNRNKVFTAAVSDTDNQDVEFNITNVAGNDGQSSSILKLGIHKQLFPGVTVTDVVKMKTKTVKTIFAENNIVAKDIDFVNIDIQGAELLAMKGMGDDIQHVQAIYTEVNKDYVYEGCALIHEIDAYLKKYNFVRVETVWWAVTHPWGDALYINKN
jgi:FkbM family methyltransferase